MTKAFRIRIDFGSDGIVDIEHEGGIGSALRKAYDECANRKTNPVAISTVQVIDSGKWIPTAPTRPA